MDYGVIKLKIKANIEYPKSFKDLYDLGYSVNDFEDKFRLKLKQNGLVLFNLKILLFQSSEEWGLKVKSNAFNVNFKDISTDYFTKKELDRFELIITECLAEFGIAARFKNDLQIEYHSQKDEFILGRIIGDENIDDHFHLIIPNQSGEGSSSPTLDHYHILNENGISQAIKDGKVVENSHTHSLPLFKKGFYSSEIVKEDQVFSHHHSNFYIDKYGNGEIKEFINDGQEEGLFDHTHKIRSGIIFPNEIGKKHNHVLRIKRIF